MVKFLSILVSTLLSLVTITADGDVPLPCTPFNFQDSTVSPINQLIQIGMTSGLLAGALKKVDPLTLTDHPLDPIPISLLGSHFLLTPIIKSLNVTGLSTLNPHSIEVKSSTKLTLGLDFNGDVNLTSSLTFHIEQVDKKWWEICWTNLLHVGSCPAKVIDVDFYTSVSKPSLSLDALISILQCDPVALQQGKCKDITMVDVVDAALSKKFDTLIQRVLRRFQTVSVEQIIPGFVRMNQVSFDIPGTAPLIVSLRKKLFECTENEINKKEKTYNDLVTVTATLTKSLANQVIQQKIVPFFGATCYDV